MNYKLQTKVRTWISKAKLCPLKAKATIPRAFKTEKTAAVDDGSEMGS